MSWNYRVMKRVYHGTNEKGHPFEETLLTMHEVHYAERTDDHPVHYTANPVDPVGETLGELRHVLGLMLLALDKPVLTEADFMKEPVQGASRECDEEGKYSVRSAVAQRDTPREQHRYLNYQIYTRLDPVRALVCAMGDDPALLAQIDLLQKLMITANHRQLIAQDPETACVQVLQSNASSHFLTTEELANLRRILALKEPAYEE